jgi:hypothetical protein
MSCDIDSEFAPTFEVVFNFCCNCAVLDFRTNFALIGAEGSFYSKLSEVYLVIRGKLFFLVVSNFLV